MNRLKEKILRYLLKEKREELNRKSQEILNNIANPCYPHFNDGERIIRYYKAREQYSATTRLLEE